MVGTTSGYEAAVDQFVTKMRRRCIISPFFAIVLKILSFISNQFCAIHRHFSSFPGRHCLVLRIWLAEKDACFLFSISLFLIGFGSFFCHGSRTTKKESLSIG